MTTTAHVPFAFARPGEFMLSVNAGVDAQAVVEHAAARLCAALDTLEAAAMDLPASGEAQQIWTALYSIETVCALLESVQLSFVDCCRAREVEGTPIGNLEMSVTLTGAEADVLRRAAGDDDPETWLADLVAARLAEITESAAE